MSLNRKLQSLAVGAAFLCPSLFLHSQANPWVGTWAAPPQRAPASAEFHGKTLRQIVHVSLGGNTLRIRLFNLYGTAPLAVDDVHIALQSNESSIVASTDRPVRFSGNAKISIPAGGSVVSDDIKLKIAPFANVSVSMFFPEPTGLATYHQLAMRTNYVADGDQAGAPDLADAKHISSYYFLTNLDVQDKKAHGAVVTLGASIADGYASTVNGNKRWPDDLAERLQHSKIEVGVLNQGISGNRLLVNGSGESALLRFDRDVLAQSGVKWVIFSDDPINDLMGSKQFLPAQDLIAAISQLISRAHAANVKFVCSTLTPFEGARAWTPEREVERAKINAFILGKESGCDAVVDQDAATHDPAHPSRFLPANDSGDHLHPNDHGLKAIADAVDLTIFSRQ